MIVADPGCEPANRRSETRLRAYAGWQLLLAGLNMAGVGAVSVLHLRVLPDSLTAWIAVTPVHGWVLLGCGSVLSVVSVLTLASLKRW